MHVARQRICFRAPRGPALDFSRGSFSKFPFSFSKSGPRGCLYCFVRCAILVNAVFVLEKTFSDLENAPRKFHGLQSNLNFQVGQDPSGDAIVVFVATGRQATVPGGDLERVRRGAVGRRTELKIKRNAGRCPTRRISMKTNAARSNHSRHSLISLAFCLEGMSVIV